MTKDNPASRGPDAPPEGPGPRAISAAGRRALAEAEARRAAAVRAPERELNGRGGLDPARYGDWEVKGLAADF
jgi:hypothetical protein